jgi:catechol 2,3-dioxygenase-like lactoylglutathione lyase family enzyme
MNLRRLSLWLISLALVFGSASSATRALAAPAVASVDRIEITVSDLGRSRAFFESVLGFRTLATSEDRSLLTQRLVGSPSARAERVELALGDERIVLTAYRSAPAGRPVPRDTHGNDLWFQHLALVVSDMDRAYAWLRKHGVEHLSSGPQTLPRWNRHAGGIKAFYFVDPDGHPLELIQFPKGKGNPRWQQRRVCALEPRERCLFLGIDHTAITVEDTAESLRFYRDVLGLSVTGESENYGTEQEHLNGVFGARLRITGLKAGVGPGIELLEYLSPRGGRLAPTDAKPSDLFHYQVVVKTPSTAALSDAARTTHPVVEDKSSKAAFVRDRDGHALLVEEAAP